MWCLENLGQVLLSQTAKTHQTVTCSVYIALHVCVIVDANLYVHWASAGTGFSDFVLFNLPSNSFHHDILKSDWLRRIDRSTCQMYIRIRTFRSKTCVIHLQCYLNFQAVRFDWHTTDGFSEKQLRTEKCEIHPSGDETQFVSISKNCILWP